MRFLIHLFIIFITPCLLIAEAQDIIFKEYDIRGIVDEEFEITDTYDLACSIATYFNQQDSQLTTLFVGADGRIHSPAIKKEFIRALLDKGFNVIDIGVCTTPVLYFALHQMSEHSAGLMITASHNPGEYNGVKMCLGKNLIAPNEIQEVKKIYKTRAFMPHASKRGTSSDSDMVMKYVDYLASSFPHLIGSEIHAIIDCGNGAAGAVLPALIQKMQWRKMELLFAEIDGTYPNHIADPTVEKYMTSLKEKLAQRPASFGLALDGDGDRMAAMTKSGKLLKGDVLLGLYSNKILKSYPGSAIVFDVSSSKALLDYVKQLGGTPHLSSTGAANVKKLMLETGALLGGEMSCHTIFKDRFFGFDDGIYSLMRFIEMMHETSSTLDQLLSQFPVVYPTPTYRIACERAVCFQIVDELKKYFANATEVELITIDGLRVHFADGWAIVRASNTEPVISIRFEGSSEESLLRIKKEFHALINGYINCDIFFN